MKLAQFIGAASEGVSALPAHRESAGSIASIASTTMSCTTRIAKARRPLRRRSSCRAVMIRRTTAVDDNENAMQIATAAGAVNPNALATG